jgi:hypothetical protein
MSQRLSNASSTGAPDDLHELGGNLALGSLCGEVECRDERKSGSESNEDDSRGQCLLLENGIWWTTSSTTTHGPEGERNQNQYRPGREHSPNKRGNDRPAVEDSANQERARLISSTAVAMPAASRTMPAITREADKVPPDIMR